MLMTESEHSYHADMRMGIRFSPVVGPARANATA